MSKVQQRNKMSEEDFMEVLNSRLQMIRYTLGEKAKEYARNDDRMHNFNRASEARRKPREVCLQGMADKHWISILDMVDDIENGKLPDIDYMEEKIGDAINYLILFEASVIDRYNKKGDTPYEKVFKE